ncbi:MAG: hypothetical protein JWM21_210 [Acidobacteria bacterium]|nr:hypothetical protein [Acidobacteriota bacterium]
MKKWLGYTLLILATISFTAAAGLAQKKADGPMECRDSWNNDRLQNHCEIREQTLPVGGMITVDAGRNGGVSVKGWDKGEILVRSRVQTAAPTQAEAEELAKQVRIDTGGLRIHSSGPADQRDFNWSVSYEIFVPRRSDLSLESHNGGISISDVNGKMEFSAMNGGVSLRRVGGNVHGSTTNGGVAVELSGDRWDGEELDVKTTNGGVSMSVPENYSAHLETGTVNGNVSVDFPVTVQGRITKELSVNLGSGGPTVRAMTTNGGIRLKRSTAN